MFIIFSVSFFPLYPFIVSIPTDLCLVYFILCKFILPMAECWNFMLSQFPSSNSSIHPWSHRSSEWPPSWKIQWTLPVLILLDSLADFDAADDSAPFLLLSWHVIPSSPSIFLASSLLLKRKCKPFLFYPNTVKGSLRHSPRPTQYSLPALVTCTYGRPTNAYLYLTLFWVPYMFMHCLILVLS